MIAISEMIVVMPLLDGLQKIYNGVLVVRTRLSIGWMNQKVSESYSEAPILKLRDQGKHIIIPPLPKKSAIDKVRNRETRISSQLWTNHWLSGVYRK
jgi:hypothetical protein